MKVKKRNGTVEDFDPQKILNAVEKAYKACGYEGIGESCKLQLNGLIELYSYSVKEVEDIENIQDNIETILMDTDGDVAKAFIRYRGERAQLRMLDDRINYIQEYSAERSNAATASETDPNANCSQKNVASLEGEVYKVWNRLIQRRMMKKKLKEMYPEVADQYEKDLENFICYTHDEASSPVLKYYTYSPMETVEVMYGDQHLLVSIKSLYDLVPLKETCVDPEADVYCKYPHNLKVRDKDGWTNITVLTKKKRHRDLVRIKTAFGEDLVVTDNHPLIVCEDASKTVEAIDSLDAKQLCLDNPLTFEGVGNYSKNNITNNNSPRLVYIL